MDIKDFLNSKGLSVNSTLEVTHRRGYKTNTVKISDILEEYFKLKTTCLKNTEEKK